MTYGIKREPRLQPSQVKLAEQEQRHFLVSLVGDQNVNQIREHPEMWLGIQQPGGAVLRKGDRVTLTSPDGLTQADQMVVIKSEGGRIWLSAPLRMISFEPEALYKNDLFEVIAHGTGYVLRHRRSGHVDTKLFATAKAAEHEAERRLPTRAA